MSLCSAAFLHHTRSRRVGLDAGHTKKLGTADRAFLVAALKTPN